MEDILEIVSKTYFGDMDKVLSPYIICSFVYDPREEIFYFTEGIAKAVGNNLRDGINLRDFSAYFYADERENVRSMFDNAVKDLTIGVGADYQIRHRLCKAPLSYIEVETSMRAITYSEGTYVIGVIANRAKSMLEIFGDQTFGGDFSQYFIIYDSLNDEALVNDRMVDDFAFRGRRISSFSKTVRSLSDEEECSRLTDVIRLFREQGIVAPDNRFRFLSPLRGEVFLKLEGISDCDAEGIPGMDKRYLSFAFSDISGLISELKFANNMLDGSSAITFNADLRVGKLCFSEKVKSLYPDANLEYEGDIVEHIAEKVLPEDRKRFKATLNQVCDGNMERFVIEIRIMTGDSVRWVACRGKTFFDNKSNSLVLVGAVFDLSQMNQVREDVEKNNSIHELTGLPTRDKLIVDASEMIRNKDLLSAAILLCDINGFHSFNDRYGRSAGNEILIALSTLLQDNLPEGASLYHIGVDVFAILWPHASRKTVSEFMNFIYEEGSQPLDTGKGTFFLSLGLSASIYPYSGSAIDELLVNAEIALHKVKQEKKLKYTIYSPVDTRELKERLDFEMKMSQSIRNNMDNFQLYYQPLISAQTGKLEGAEALLRWVAPGGETVNPERVVNALESTDQMEIVGNWILNEAIMQCSKWIKEGAPKDFYVHINVTADDILRKDFANSVMETLARYELSPRNILIEITETSLMRNLAMSRRNLIKLRSENVKIALDDFGTGYSSFNYLKELPVDEIKIDKSFVDDVETVEFNKEFIKSITQLVHTIKMRVVVEGVENENQRNMIRDMGADIFQGYFFDKPLTVFAFENKYFKAK